jgi:hypothetical protein
METPLHLQADANWVSTRITQQLTEAGGSLTTVLPLVSRKNSSANKIIAVKQSALSVKQLFGHPVFNPSVSGTWTPSMVWVPGYRSRGPGFDSRRYQIFWEVVGLQRGPLSLVRITEELPKLKCSGSGSRKLRLTSVGIRCADHATPSIRKRCH